MHPAKTQSAPPSQSRSQFLGQFLLGGSDLEVYLDVLWGRRLEKVVSFFGKKSAPPDKILATPMAPGVTHPSDATAPLLMSYFFICVQSMWRRPVFILSSGRIHSCHFPHTLTPAQSSFTNNVLCRLSLMHYWISCLSKRCAEFLWVVCDCDLKSPCFSAVEKYRQD